MKPSEVSYVYCRLSLVGWSVLLQLPFSIVLPFHFSSLLPPSVKFLSFFLRVNTRLTIYSLWERGISSRNLCCEWENYMMKAPRRYRLRCVISHHGRQRSDCKVAEGKWRNSTIMHSIRLPSAVYILNNMEGDLKIPAL